MIVWLLDISIFMLLVITFRAIFYRTITARARYLVWILVFVRLAVPLSSFENPINILVAANSAATSISADNQQETLKVFANTETGSETQADSSTQQQPVKTDGNSKSGFTLSLDIILIAIWIAGSCISFLWYFAANRRLKKIKLSMTRHEMKQCRLPVYVSS